MKYEEAVRIAKELVETYNTEIKHMDNDTYVVLRKDMLIDYELKQLIPYISKYMVSIHADGQNEIRILIR